MVSCVTGSFSYQAFDQSGCHILQGACTTHRSSRWIWTTIRQNVKIYPPKHAAEGAETNNHHEFPNLGQMVSDNEINPAKQSKKCKLPTRQRGNKSENQTAPCVGLCGTPNDIYRQNLAPVKRAPTAVGYTAMCSRLYPPSTPARSRPRLSRDAIRIQASRSQDIRVCCAAHCARDSGKLKTISLDQGVLQHQRGTAITTWIVGMFSVGHFSLFRG
jgi:hypothetical protein